jgi:tetratricopeptide (TPR) repeat protein
LNFLKLKQFEKSLQAFDIAIELKEMLNESDLLPSNIDGVVKKVAVERIYANRANVKLSLKDFTGCLNDCQTSIKLNPNYSTSYFILGLLFVEVNQENDAIQAFEVAEQLGHQQAGAAMKHFFGR